MHYQIETPNIHISNPYSWSALARPNHTLRVTSMARSCSLFFFVQWWQWPSPDVFGLDVRCFGFHLIFTKYWHRRSLEFSPKFHYGIGAERLHGLSNFYQHQLDKAKKTVGHLYPLEDSETTDESRVWQISWFFCTVIMLVMLPFVTLHEHIFASVLWYHWLVYGLVKQSNLL